MSGTSGAPADSFPTAELDRRFYAFALDRLLAWTLDGIAVYAAYVLFFEKGSTIAGVALIVGTVVGVSLVMSFVLGLLGTSPGKAAVGLRVVDDSTGTPIGVGPAMLRSVVLGLAALPTFGIGVATLAWTSVMDLDRQRRGWHDHLVKSVVVDVRPAPVEEEEAPTRPRQIVNLTAMRLVPASPTPPREIPARVRRSRWAAGPSIPGDDAPPTGTAPSAPVIAAVVATPAAPVAAPTPTPAAPVVPPATTPPPVATPPSVQSPAPVVAPPREPVVPEPVARAYPDPDALAGPVATPPVPARRRAADLGDSLADPLGTSASRPAAASRPGPRHAGPERDAPTPETAAVAPRATGTWTVAFDTGDTFRVEGFTLVGRNPEPRSGEHAKRLVALPSQDMSLSKTHAQFQVVPDGALVVMDRGSTNGSILIRGGVTRELGPGKPASLRDGDLVRFGDREMRVTLEP